MSSLDPSESQCVSSRAGSYSPLTRPLKLDLTSHLNSSIELPYNSCDSDQQDETAILSIDPSTQAHPNSQGGVDLMNSEVSQYGWSGAVGDREDDVSRVARNGAADVNRAAVAVSNDGCPTPSRINNDWSEVTPSCRLDNHSEVLTAVSDRSMVFDWSDPQGSDATATSVEKSTSSWKENSAGSIESPSIKFDEINNKEPLEHEKSLRVVPETEERHDDVSKETGLRALSTLGSSKVESINNSEIIDSPPPSPFLNGWASVNRATYPYPIRGSRKVSNFNLDKTSDEKKTSRSVCLSDSKDDSLNGETKTALIKPDAMDQRRKSLFIPKSYSSQTNMRVRLSDLGTKSNENPTVVEIKGDMASEAATPSELMQVLKKSDLTTVEADWSWDNMGNDSVPEGVTDSNVSQDLDHKSRNSVEVETKGEEEMSSEKKELKKPLKLDMNLLEIIVRAVVLNLKLLKTRHIHDETLKNLEKFKRSTLGLHPVHRKIYGAKLEESVLRVSSIQAELDAYLHGLDDEFCDTLVTLVEPHYDTLHSENLTLDSWRPKPVEYIQPSITNLCSSPVKQVFENPRSPVKAADPSDDWSSWGAGPSNTTKGSNPSTFSENATQASQDQISGWGQSDFSSSLGSSKNPNLTPIGGFKGQSSSFNSGGGWSSESSGNNRNDESSTYNSGGWGGGGEGGGWGSGGGRGRGWGGRNTSGGEGWGGGRGGGRGGYRAEGREGGFNRGRGRGSYENSSGSGGGSGWGNSNGFSRGRGYAPRGRAEGHGSGMTSSWGNNSSNSEAVSSFNSGERSSFSGGWGQVDEGLGGGNNSTSGQNSSKTTESNSTWSTGHQDSSKTDGNPTTNSEDYSSAWNSY